jgi:hypothetical protein
LVHDAQGTKAVAARRVAATLALSICLIALGGCSESSPRPGEAGPTLGTPARLADCTDWRKGDVRERLGTVREIRAFAGGPTGSPPGRGRVLKDEQAYELFENYCKNRFARGFKLYKLYTRAAAFKGH